MEQSCYNCIHLKVCKNWAEVSGHPERLDLDIGCLMFESITNYGKIRHAMWYPTYFHHSDTGGYTCSFCGRRGSKSYRYCPHCEAVMDLEVE